MPIRLAVRAVLVHGGRLLVVNAWPGRHDLFCAPGGGAEMHQSLPDNLVREVREETGLEIRVGPPCLVNEFHDPDRPFHQVEMFFRCTLVVERTDPVHIDPAHVDPEGVVTRRLWISRPEAEDMTTAKRLRPASLPAAAWARGIGYDPLEPLLR
ncbi:NUDIX domain-containing protein [Hasllibacter halocynthiae]|uniref:NUDIX domain-containing protein n=1 Tax=Hasllibacter halocynthiae TaxID=595589 RepID=UPI000D0611AF|nr:NUDIX domain-containing protein [Hasllibacter halocynthiae]